jgi:hypothetical protein
MRQLSEQDAKSGSKRASEHEEFLRFLEAAKRQRQEQRKVARLVLEGSMHGGMQYFLPARGTSSVALPAGAVLGSGHPSDLGDDDGEEGEGTDIEEDEEDEAMLAPTVSGVLLLAVVVLTSVAEARACCISDCTGAPIPLRMF